MKSDDLNITTIIVENLEKSLRLDLFLSSNLTDTSRSLATKIITNGHCEVNGKTITKASSQVHNGDTISIYKPESQKVSLDPENIPLNIVFEDEDLIVINKDFGMVVHPSIGHYTGTLVNALLFHCKTLSMGYHEHRPGIVHRLDKDTGGLIVIAKTQAAHTHLSAQFKNKTAGRIYKAITFNRFKNEKGSIESYLIRHPKNRLKYTSTPESKSGKWAKTHYEVLINGPISYVKLNLETGRTHQIRVHLADMGHPILNDEIYSSPGQINNIQDAGLKSVIKQNSNMFLFAEELHLIHPSNNQPMSFTAKLPNCFDNLLKSLNEFVNL